LVDVTLGVGVAIEGVRNPVPVHGVIGGKGKGGVGHRVVLCVYRTYLR
jgi:hypothetical protein